MAAPSAISSSGSNRRRGEKLRKKKRPSAYHFRKRELNGDIEKALSSIEDVEAKLHVIRFSGNYGYKELKEKLGNLKDFTHRNENEKYGRKYIRSFSGFQIHVFVNPDSNYLPPCLVEIYPTKAVSPESYKKFLNDLAKKLPELKVRNVEYTIDLFCDYASSVQSLFWVLRRFLYVPWQRESELIVSKDKVDDLRFSDVYRVTKNQKVYERGKNSEKQKEGGWLSSGLNRVRLEHTVKRKELLRRARINTIEDLVRLPKFFLLNSNKWQFKQFRKSKKVPRAFHDYKAKDKHGHSGCFQFEYLTLRKKNLLRKPSQHIIDTPGLRFLKEKIHKAMHEFDQKWRKRKSE